MTVHIINKIDEEPDILPDRYSQDSDDHLMNMMISKGFAFSKEKGSKLNIEVDCGCNCNCCFGQKKVDLWETSKDCGCNCGCCNMNKVKVRKAPQFWVNREGALKAGTEIVRTNLHLEGEKLSDYMMMNFGEVWDSYDILGTGLVEVEQMSSFYKKVLHDFKIAI